MHNIITISEIELKANYFLVPIEEEYKLGDVVSLGEGKYAELQASILLKRKKITEPIVYRKNEK